MPESDANPSHFSAFYDAIRCMTHWEKELEIVRKTKSPVTKTSLLRDLETLGLSEGDAVLVHSSLSSIGWVVGGSVTVIDSLMEIVGSKGTLVMPAFTTGNTEPSGWNYPPVPESWWPAVRREMPPFDKSTTPLRGLGRIPETFRKYPRVHRSSHPQLSFTAWGKKAEEIIARQPLESPFGSEGPLGKLYEVSSKILLFGVGHASNTSLHLAEEMASIEGHPRSIQGSAMLEKGERVWKTWEQMDHESDDFRQLGEDYDEAMKTKSKKVGLAESKLIEIRSLVDFAIEWLRKHREYN